ncbi:hypothetical protein BEN47_05885 [Hymenobacter lapidarius]|uniref:Cell division protein FtsL n=2 Tax=Hymenobacter lapidarius TaxID=1908237 RepID=A0A1G1SS76_9BACT|nr:hypothetical protein BEN47_05885 [Hymenobacter lapidarius]
MPAPAPEVLPQAVAVEAPEPEPAPVPVAEKRPRRPKPEPRADARPKSSWSLFSLLDRVTSVDGLFREGLPVRYLPHLLFVMLLTLLYIGNTHYGNRMNRSIQRLKQETEDLRADYTTLKSDYMEASKQSEVARKVAAFGLVESSSPPFRISVPAGRLDAAELELMPVLTADTLSARAARDSAAAQQKASLSGRKRSGAAGADDTDTVEPEIIAPPQGIDSASAGGAAPTAQQVDKPNNRMRVQKSTSQSKAKSPNKQAVRTDSR